MTLLAATAGFVDAACFLGLSGPFTAHVTGNIAALTSALVHPTRAITLRIEVLTAFACGAVSARIVTRRPRASDDVARSTRRRTLYMESLWLMALVVAWYVLNAASASEAARNAVVTMRA